MLRWREPLLTHPPMEEVRRVRRLCEKGQGLPGYYLITLSDTPGNRLEILPCVLLRQRDFFRQVPLILGLAKGRDAAIELAVEIEKELDCFIPR